MKGVRQMPSVLKWMSRHNRKDMEQRIRAMEEKHTNRDDVLSVFDVPYVSDEGVRLTMDIYRPADMETQGRGPRPDQKPDLLPVILVVHGGGLFVGHPRMEREVCEYLASRGFLVFALSYRLITEADGIGELSDLTAGFNHAGSLLASYGGDPDRIYLVGESAGAWLSLYTAAMTRSERIRRAIGLKAASIRIRGIVFVSGMFYTGKKDVIGLIYPRDLFGDRRKDPDFMQYMDPENEKVIKSLPPVVLTSSRADYLRKYTLSYARALKKAGHKCRLIYFPQEDKELVHAFVTLKPDLPESREAWEKIIRMIKPVADKGKP